MFMLHGVLLHHTLSLPLFFSLSLLYSTRSTFFFSSLSLLFLYTLSALSSSFPLYFSSLSPLCLHTLSPLSLLFLSPSLPFLRIELGALSALPSPPLSCTCLVPASPFLSLPSLTEREGQLKGRPGPARHSGEWNITPAVILSAGCFARPEPDNDGAMCNGFAVALMLFVAEMCCSISYA